jgi:hypothetical protein
MAFPVREATATTSDNSDPLLANLPASIAAGDVLVVSLYNIAGQTPTTPTGWALEASGSNLYIYSRTADGGEGATVSITNGGGGGAIAISRRYSGGSGNVEALAVAASYDAGALTPSWGAKDTLWDSAAAYALAVGGVGDGVPPTNYANLVEQASGFVGSGHAYRTLNATSEDPGAWSSGDGARAVTLIAIEPAGAAGGGGAINMLLLGVG